MKPWCDDYSKLDIVDGKIKFILEDDEDMIEIRYMDGMLIDVGYIEETRAYYITVVVSNDINGWENPLEECEVKNKVDLISKIQETIYKYRKEK